jgi:hypothetical protein
MLNYTTKKNVYNQPKIEAKVQEVAGFGGSGKKCIQGTMIEFN